MGKEVAYINYQASPRLQHKGAVRSTLAYESKVCFSEDGRPRLFASGGMPVSGSSLDLSELCLDGLVGAVSIKHVS